MIKFSIYFTSHMCIARPIMDILSERIHVLYRTVVHIKMSLFLIYDILTWVPLFVSHFIPCLQLRIIFLPKIMLPMLESLTNYGFHQQTICTFPALILKSYILLELFPFKASKNVPFHVKCNENNIIFFPIIC